MIRLLQLLFVGHVHKWKTVEKHTIRNLDVSKFPMGTAYIQQCEHCGKVVRRDLT